MHTSVKWPCLWWQNLAVLATRLGTEITESKMKMGILNRKTCLTVQFVVQNLHFYCCCILLELSLEKNTLVYNKSQAFFSLSVSGLALYQYLKAKHSSV